MELLFLAKYSKEIPIFDSWLGFDLLRIPNSECSRIEENYLRMMVNLKFLQIIFIFQNQMLHLSL